MDDVHAVWEGVVDWSKFSIRVKQSELHRTAEILTAISDERVEEMQKALTKVWHRFAYATSPLHRTMMHGIYQGNAYNSGVLFNHTGHHFNPRTRYPRKDDALHTIMQWLYGKMERS
eukprot:gene12372-15557_t